MTLQYSKAKKDHLKRENDYIQMWYSWNYSWLRYVKHGHMYKHTTPTFMRTGLPGHEEVNIGIAWTSLCLRR